MFILRTKNNFFYNVVVEIFFIIKMFYIIKLFADFERISTLASATNHYTVTLYSRFFPIKRFDFLI